MMKYIYIYIFVIVIIINHSFFLVNVLSSLLGVNWFKDTTALNCKESACGKSSIPIKPELEKEKHKVDDVVTVDKKHRDNNNDIQGPEDRNSNCYNNAQRLCPDRGKKEKPMTRS